MRRFHKLFLGQFQAKKFSQFTVASHVQWGLLLGRCAQNFSLVTCSLKTPRGMFFTLELLWATSHVTDTFCRFELCLCQKQKKPCNIWGEVVSSFQPCLGHGDKIFELRIYSQKTCQSVTLRQRNSCYRPIRNCILASRFKSLVQSMGSACHFLMQSFSHACSISPPFHVWKGISITVHMLWLSAEITSAEHQGTLLNFLWFIFWAF